MIIMMKKQYLFSKIVGLALCWGMVAGLLNGCSGDNLWDVLPVANFDLQYSTPNGHAGPPPCTVTLTNTTAKSVLSTTHVWTVNDSQIATSKDASHTFTSAGTYLVKLTATNRNGSHSVEKTVTILDVKVTGITISPANAVTVEVGKTATLSATIAPDNASNKNVTWSSLNTNIATVNAQTGVVTGVSAGTATICATAADGSGVIADKSVTVVQPEVTVGTQSGILRSGVVGSVTFPVTTANVPNGQAGTITWYTSVAGTTTTSAPAGISATVDNVANNAATVTVNATTAAIEGIHYYRVTIYGIQSNIVTLTVSPKTVTLGVQNGTLRAGVTGSVTFPVSTTNINNGQAGTITWYTTAEGSATANAPAGVTATVSNVSNNAATVAVNATTASVGGVYFFRVTIDSVPSEVAMLTIRSVSVGVQAGALHSGTAGTTSFPVTTVGIADGQTGTITWYSSAAGTTTTSAPAGVTASVGNVSNHAATVTINTTAAAVAAIRYFRVTIDGVQSGVATLTIKSLSVGTQNGTLSAGTAGTATFSVSTMNITDGNAGTVTWYTSAEGTTTANAPTGVTSSVSNVSSNTATVTMNSTTTAAAGTYYFRVTIDGVQSGVATLSIRSVTVGAQNGEMRWNLGGSVTFPITTIGIANGQAGTVTWYSNSAGTTTRTAPSGITVSVSNVSNNATIVTLNSTSTSSTGTWYFRVTINGVQSNVATFTIKYVGIYAQSGALTGGTAGSTTFPVTTTGIANGQVGTIMWYTTSAGTVATSPPAGVSASVSNVTSNAATVTINTTSAAVTGSYYFRITIDGVQTSVATLTIIASITALEPTMVFVQGGTFTMGALANDPDAFSNERPNHQVTLSDYYIGKYQVTQKEWTSVMGGNPSSYAGDNRPVNTVSWNDIVGTSGSYMELHGIRYYENGFIYKLNTLTGKKYRLPTESEWEYAARGGNQSQGYIYSGSNNVDEVAWYSGNYGSPYLRDVGLKKANELGIHDMSGNVWEWCSDWWGSYTVTDKTNPTGPATGSYRVFRGGDFNANAPSVRVSYRNNSAPDYRIIGIGFRLACSSE